jgi:hypothetical protein
MNNKEAYYLSGWLNVWLDGISLEDSLSMFGDKKSYDEIRELYLEVFEEYYTDGWYPFSDLTREEIKIIQKTLAEFDNEAILVRHGNLLLTSKAHLTNTKGILISIPDLTLEELTDYLADYDVFYEHRHGDKYFLQGEDAHYALTELIADGFIARDAIGEFGK